LQSEVKRCVIFPGCLLLFFLVGSAFASEWSGRVAAVIDGDSIEVMHGEKRVRIRLYGIDTPEYRQPHSAEAREFTAALTANRRVLITEKDIDRYGRTVALVRVEDILVNAELLRAGLARVYRWYCREYPLCADWLHLEETARRQRLGIWSNPGK